MGTKLLKIGITGGIGTGKTIVSEIFHLLGVPVYNADERGKWLLSNNEKVKEGLLKIFGEEAFQNHVLNRSFISQQVFNDKSKLKMLNELVHPAVGKDFVHWLEGKEKYPYVLKEAALLFEAGSYKDLDKVIVVSSPEDLRIRRVLQRDPQRTEGSLKKIMKEQMDEEEKLKKADYIIYNDEKNLLIPQVIRLHKLFCKESKNV